MAWVGEVGLIVIVAIMWGNMVSIIEQVLHEVGQNTAILHNIV